MKWKVFWTKRSLEVIKGYLIGNDLTSSDVPPIYPGAFKLGRCPNFGLIRNSSLEGSSERGGIIFTRDTKMAFGLALFV